jgi:hypothetical protein
MGARNAALNRGIAHETVSLDIAVRLASGVDECLGPLNPSVRPVSAPGPGTGPDGPGESSGDPAEEELLLPCPTTEDDAQMVRAYEAIARQRAEYAPRYKACIKEVERLREMRRYIFHQSRALAQQMLADTGPYGVDAQSNHMNSPMNEQAHPTKKRPRPAEEPMSEAETEAARCHTFGCTLSARHRGVHRFDRFADPPHERCAGEPAPTSTTDGDFDGHALLDAPIAHVRDGLLHGLRRMARQPHAAPFRAAPAADVLACLDYVVARLDGWVYTNAQQPFSDLDAIWDDATLRCAPDSWTACYAHKLRGETEMLRKAAMQRLGGATGY